MSVKLFEREQDCCGCGACKNVCPRDAISMVADVNGYVYPHIDTQRCIECNACEKVCGYRSAPQKSLPKVCYAVAAKDKQLLDRAASGGLFAALAVKILREGGAVYGTAMFSEKQEMVIRHIRVDSEQELPMLQGSKYVQSDIAWTYRQAKHDLREGRSVLFSGTPCQIAGLVSYLGRPYENLLTVEVICHGVPNSRMFQDFLKILEEKEGRAITDFHFRSKKKGQGMNTYVSYLGTDGKRTSSCRNGHTYSYMHYFLKSYIYRTSCYSCPFAAAERVADITIGDYWGFHEEHPVLPSDVCLSNVRGVSCALLNTENGIRSFDKIRKSLTVLETGFEKIAKHNAQLCAPCSCQQERDVILRIYREQGYGAVEQHYRKNCWKVRLTAMVLDLIPKGLKRAMKRMVGLLR